MDDRKEAMGQQCVCEKLLEQGKHRQMRGSLVAAKGQPHTVADLLHSTAWHGHMRRCTHLQR